MSEKQQDGTSLREHLESIWKQTKKKPKELEELVDLPECMREYWDWFLRLNTRRPSGMSISAIPYSEMQAFFSLCGIYPDPYEVEILEIFDKIALREFNDQSEREQKRNKKPSKTSK